MGPGPTAPLSTHVSTGRPLAVVTGLVLALVAMIALALSLGAYPLGPSAVLRALLSLIGGPAPANAQDMLVLFSIRGPRVLAALLLGAALAAAGCAYQTLFRNPLVSPDLLGVSSGAGLGAVTGIFLSWPVIGIQLLSFAGGLVTVACVLAVASAVRRQESVLVLVLSGVVIGALAGSLTALLKVLADPYDQLPAITFWLLGSLAGIVGDDLLMAMPVTLLGLVPMVLLRWRVDVLAMGDEEARSLGIDVRRLRLMLIGSATLMTSAVVAFAGVVGWVGLVIPHLARMLVGPGFSRLLPVAMLCGALFMLLVDTLARSLVATEVPLGILTALVGAPIFVLLLARGRRVWQ